MQPGELLKQARKAIDLNQKDAAARCGVSFSAYEKWERGANEIPPAMLAGCILLLGGEKSAALAAAKAHITEQ